MDSKDGLDHSSHAGDDSSTSSERSKLTIQEKIVQAGKEAVRKTKNIGRRKSPHRRRSTNPVALAATRVYEESVKASKAVLHIVSAGLETGFSFCQASISDQASDQLQTLDLKRFYPV